MLHRAYYDSPVGTVTMIAREDSLIGLWIEGQKYYLNKVANDIVDEQTPALTRTMAWLDRYFAAENPSIAELSLEPQGSDFAKSVWRILCEIPYGQTTTYGAIARQIAEQRGIARMSSQAVGGAVGHNPISIIIPCHRVIGSDGSLTGYAGGLDKKIWLLTHEGCDMTNIYRPKRGTAL